MKHELERGARVKPPKLDADFGNLLGNIREGKELLQSPKGTKLFVQGAPADAVYFIQTGQVKVTSRSAKGRDEVLAIIGPGEFFGEGCLVGQSLRITTATTTQFSTTFRIQQRAMLQALLVKPKIFEKLIATLLIHNILVEADLSKQAFSTAERRLALVLLKLSRYGHDDFLPDAALSQLSHETLAVLVGVTRSRIAHSLSRFEKLGLIHYDVHGAILVRNEMMADMVRGTKPSGLSGNPVSSLMRPTYAAFSSPVAELETVRSYERQWKETSYAGTWICNLFNETAGGYGAILVKMAAGAHYPERKHRGREQIYVIEGDVKIGADSLYAGDYHRAERSVRPRQVSSETGCICIILGYTGSISARKS